MAPPKSVSAESAIHFWLRFMPSLPPCPNRLVRLLFISFLAPGIVSLVESNVRPRVHAYLAIICRDLGAELVHVGGVADHVHVVTTLPRTLSQADLVEADKESILEMDQSA